MVDRAAAASMAASRAERERRYEEGIAAWHREHDDQEPAHLKQAAIDACDQCDKHGYPPNSATPCDHRDRSGQRGSHIAREALLEAQRDRGKPHNLDARSTP